jgi:hypothetical protein
MLHKPDSADWLHLYSYLNSAIKETLRLYPPRSEYLPRKPKAPERDGINAAGPGQGTPAGLAFPRPAVTRRAPRGNGDSQRTAQWAHT